MALFNLPRHGAKADREPVLRDREQILAYFEQLFRMRAVLSLKVAEDGPIAYASRVEGVSEEKGTLTLSLENRPPQEPKPNAPVHLWFSLDGLRFRTVVRFIQRGGYMQSEFQLPEGILHAERRGLQRARFTARENVRVVLLENLFGGHGASGRLVNLSLAGLSVQVSKVMDLAEDRRVSPRPELFPIGAELALVRLQDLPQTPTLETTGAVRHCEPHAGGLRVGISFGVMGGFELQALGKLLAQRLPGFALGFPLKRRQADLEDALAAGESEELEAPEALPEPEAREWTEAEAALSDSEIEDLREVVRLPDHQAILRKRGRQILLVIGDDLERAALHGHLHADGYRCVHEARGLVQALERSRKHRLDLVILNQQVGPHTALEVVEKLRGENLLERAGVVVLKAREDVRLTLAAKAGGVTLVVPRPLDFEGELKPGIEPLLGL